MTTGAWVLVVALLVALSYGAWRARTDGRFRASRRREPVSTGSTTTSERSTAETAPTTTAERSAGETAATTTSERSTGMPDEATSVLAGTPFDGRRGERATLLQLSSAFCAPCRMTRQVLAQVAEATPGVVHLEVDAEQHLDLVRRLHVLRTPTTLVLAADGREVTRAGGTPRREQVLGVLEQLR